MGGKGSELSVFDSELSGKKGFRHARASPAFPQKTPQGTSY